MFQSESGAMILPRSGLFRIASVRGGSLALSVVDSISNFHPSQLPMVSGSTV